jgi:hypothetical protein
MFSLHKAENRGDAFHVGRNAGGEGQKRANLGAVTARQKSLTAAARRTVAALKKRRALEEVDELKIQNVYFTADQLDHLNPLASPAMIASMTRAHLAACQALFGQEPANNDDALAEVIAALSTPLGYAGPMGDAPEDGEYRIPGQVPPWMK